MFQALAKAAGILFGSSPSKLSNKTDLLSTLPIETQLLIIQHLHRRDKLNLLRASHHFFNLVQPQIYTHLTEIRNTQTLVGTLIRNPSLCQYTQTLRLKAWDTPQPWANSSYNNSNADQKLDLDLLLLRYDLIPILHAARTASLTCTESSQWEHGLKAWNPDAWIALLLTLLPNLAKLEIQFPDCGTYVPRIIRRAALRQFNIPLSDSVLQNLEEVYISAAFDPPPNTQSLITPFFGLPKLRYLFTDILLETDEPLPSSPITHLAIGNCHSLAALDKLIINIPNLQSYRHGYFPYTTWHTFDNHLIYPALLQARATLKEIWLDLDRPHENAVWPGFKEFGVLERLHAPYFILGDFDTVGAVEPFGRLTAILPGTLMRLHVTQIGSMDSLDRVLPYVVDYVEAGQGKLAELAVITQRFIEGIEMHRSLDPLEWTGGSMIGGPAARLGAVCKERGVELLVTDRNSPFLREWRFEEAFPRRDLR